MSVLSQSVTDEIRVAVESALRASDSSESFSGECELSKHGTELQYEMTYWEYHRMGDIEHGVEVVFRLQDDSELVASDIEGIKRSLTQILRATVSFEGRVELEAEDTEHVFIEEILHSF